ncbi:MAG: phosphopantothenate/pantothenate synthetase [Methanotrichaceae archaeon]|nr:phosphopantothenate/pantothenate synthetase [Methanotrichaceae archaeon]
MTEIPKTHPRYLSLVAREKVAAGVAKGFTSTQGLIAQGRGEAFDYLIGERTTPSAAEATRAAAAMLLHSRRPAISVNGNVAALMAEEMVALAKALNAPLEVNLFHRSEERVGRIADLLRFLGAEHVLGERPDAIVPGLDHARAKATSGGIYDADVVLIPLEDGDRCEALLAMGKKTIAIDLNPLSRTAVKATISIVDNVTRALPNLIAAIEELKRSSEGEIEEILASYDNRAALRMSLEEIKSTLSRG